MRKYHYNKLRTNPWYSEEEPDKNMRHQVDKKKQSNQLPLPHRGDCNTRSPQWAQQLQRINNRTTALEWTAAKATGGIKCVLLP